MKTNTASSFDQFSAIGGNHYEGETFHTMRLFTDYVMACDYANELVKERHYEYAYVSGIYPVSDGTMELEEITRIKAHEVELNYQFNFN